MNSVIVYNKEFVGYGIEDLDPMDILNSDDIIVDIFGEPQGKFIVQVTYIPDSTYDQYED